jgi:hypothetical protein
MTSPRVPAHHVNLDAMFTKGRPPWSPSPDARDLNVWYEYDYPYTGTFVVHGVTVLFNVLEGIETDTTVWAYACLEPVEAHDLAAVSFASPTELNEFVHEKLKGRQLVFALADDLLITNWAGSETAALGEAP